MLVQRPLRGRLQVLQEARLRCSIVSVLWNKLPTFASDMSLSGGPFRQFVRQLVAFDALMGRDPVKLGLLALGLNYLQALNNHFDNMLAGLPSGFPTRFEGRLIVGKDSEPAL